MIENIRQDIKAHLKPSRYKHTLGVCKLAVSLAKWYGIDVYDAEIAALLHDYAKYESDESILAVYRETDEPVDAVIKNHPNLGHGYVSAVLARKKYDINDGVFNAIKNHTFGNTGMTLLEKIIYLADALEEGRDYEGIEEVRSFLYKDLNTALLMACENTLLFEIKRGNMVHMKTVLMRNELLEEK